MYARVSRLEVDPWALLGDTLSMILMVAVSVLATLAYGL
jgi:hypothetical protein